MLGPRQRMSAPTCLNSTLVYRTLRTTGAAKLLRPRGSRSALFYPHLTLAAHLHHWPTDLPSSPYIRTSAATTTNSCSDRDARRLQRHYASLSIVHVDAGGSLVWYPRSEGAAFRRTRGSTGIWFVERICNGEALAAKAGRVMVWCLL